jgi:2-(1,2-epoxy-1,2-dihydrophenyl)acetyl-CoA isomerase
MAYENLAYEKRDHVGIVTLNRPEVLNALNHALHEDLFEAVEEVRNDDEVRVMVLTGAGRGFCSGADLTGRTPHNPTGEDRERQPGQNELIDDLQWFGRQASGIYGLDKPTIAAVNGVAVGAGMSLAMYCDLRVGSEQTRFRTIFLERGISPDSSLSYTLPRIIGYAKAMDLFLTSREVGGEEALELGLLNRLVPHEKLLEETLAYAAQLTRWPPLAVRMAKRVTQQNLNRNLEDALRNESVHLGYSRRATSDLAEMLQARAEKRPGVYTGT